MRAFLLSFFLLSTFLPAAQERPATLIWPKKIGNDKTDVLYEMTLTEKGNIFAVGTSMNSLWMVHTTTSGEILDEYKIFPKCKALGVALAPDGGVLIAGECMTDREKVVPLLLKTNEKGRKVRLNQAFKENTGRFNDVVGLPNGNIVATGELDGQFVVVKLNSLLKKEWNVEFGQGSGQVVDWQGNGVLAVAGQLGHNAIWMELESKNGHRIGDRREQPNAQVGDMIEVDRGYAIAGTVMTAHNREDGFIWQIDQSNGADAFLTFGGLYEETVRCLTRMGGSHFYVGGGSKSKDVGARRDKMWLAGLNTANIDSLVPQHQFFGGSQQNMAHDLLPLTDGNLLALCKGAYRKGGKQGAWLLKLDVGLPKAPDTVPPLVKVPQPKFTRPEIEWSKPDPHKVGLSFQHPVRLIEVEIKVKSGESLKSQDVKLILENGEGIKKMNGTLVPSLYSPKGVYSYIFSTPSKAIELRPGNNKVWAEVDQHDHYFSSDTLQIFYELPGINLHVWAMGVPQKSGDLQYTTNDALDLANALQGQSNHLYNEVKTHVFTTENETTAQSLRKGIKDITNSFDSGEIDSNDMVILYMSAHGFSEMINGERKVYIQGSDYVPQYYDIYSIDLKEDVLDRLKEINCKVLLLIDACRSGALPEDGGRPGDIGDNPDNVAAAIEQNIRATKGVRIITSCQANEKSYEDPAWENGAFTQALLEALGIEKVPFKVDTNDDGFLSIRELYEYIDRRVPQMVRKEKDSLARQHPYMIEKWRYSNIPLFYLKK